MKFLTFGDGKNDAIMVDNYEEDLTYIYSFIKMILCKCKFNELKDNIFILSK